MPLICEGKWHGYSYLVVTIANGKDKEAVSVIMLSTTSGNEVRGVGKGRAMPSQ
jgi:hypothetical protein